MFVDIISQDALHVTLGRVCPSCGKQQTLTLDIPVLNRGLELYRNGARIQNAFPTLTPDQREFFLTGICSKCWDNM